MIASARGGVRSNRCQLPAASNSGYTVYDQNGVVRRFVPNSFGGDRGGIVTRVVLNSVGGYTVYGRNGPARRVVPNDDEDY